jgi:hypothetical protein
MSNQISSKEMFFTFDLVSIYFTQSLGYILFLTESLGYILKSISHVIDEAILKEQSFHSSY